eukprot:TRINITY_DN1100_c0_g4_i1.p1 TRINITY_DN1100_c0_g4~~TRINITY_DN1100_c0_g4_i1.p1  ORF type:complete len:1190 (+),score=355.73 TRINITY_DN1100_c0_g4_i1:118-3687(+)
MFADPIETPPPVPLQQGAGGAAPGRPFMGSGSARPSQGSPPSAPPQRPMRFSTAMTAPRGASVPRSPPGAALAVQGARAASALLELDIAAAGQCSSALNCGSAPEGVQAAVEGLRELLADAAQARKEDAGCSLEEELYTAELLTSLLGEALDCFADRYAPRQHFDRVWQAVPRHRHWALSHKYIVAAAFGFNTELRRRALLQMWAEWCARSGAALHGDAAPHVPRGYRSATFAAKLAGGKAAEGLPSDMEVDTPMLENRSLHPADAAQERDLCMAALRFVRLGEVAAARDFFAKKGHGVRSATLWESQEILQHMPGIHDEIRPAVDAIPEEITGRFGLDRGLDRTRTNLLRFSYYGALLRMSSPSAQLPGGAAERGLYAAICGLVDEVVAALPQQRSPGAAWRDRLWAHCRGAVEHHIGATLEPFHHGHEEFRPTIAQDLLKRTAPRHRSAAECAVQLLRDSAMGNDDEAHFAVLQAELVHVLCGAELEPEKRAEGWRRLYSTLRRLSERGSHLATAAGALLWQVRAEVSGIGVCRFYGQDAYVTLAWPDIGAQKGQQCVRRYYEVTVHSIADGGKLVLGWMRKELAAAANSFDGVGLDAAGSSWGTSSAGERLRCGEAAALPGCRPWVLGSVVGVAVDCDAGEVMLFVDGQWRGIFAAMDVDYELCPVVSARQCEVSFNMRGPFRLPPPWPTGSELPSFNPLAVPRDDPTSEGSCAARVIGGGPELARWRLGEAGSALEHETRELLDGALAAHAVNLCREHGTQARAEGVQAVQRLADAVVLYLGQMSRGAPKLLAEFMVALTLPESWGSAAAGLHWYDSTARRDQVRLAILEAGGARRIDRCEVLWHAWATLCEGLGEGDAGGAGAAGLTAGGVQRKWLLSPGSDDGSSALPEPAPSDDACTEAVRVASLLPRMALLAADCYCLLGRVLARRCAAARAQWRAYTADLSAAGAAEGAAAAREQEALCKEALRKLRESTHDRVADCVALRCSEDSCNPPGAHEKRLIDEALIPERRDLRMYLSFLEASAEWRAATAAADFPGRAAGAAPREAHARKQLIAAALGIARERTWRLPGWMESGTRGRRGRPHEGPDAAWLADREAQLRELRDLVIPDVVEELLTVAADHSDHLSDGQFSEEYPSVIAVIGAQPALLGPLGEPCSAGAALPRIARCAATYLAQRRARLARDPS